ncbi:helix-turn-helix domain-containing protein [Candidatus Nitrotoga sp. BS]
MHKENGNMTRVAKNVGLERTHLYRKLKQLDVKFAKKNLDEN